MRPTGRIIPPANNVPFDTYTSPHMRNGIVSTSMQSIFGPQICTAYGDPFSPFNSRYTPGLYQYRYRIEIPADYPHNILRVELFDPDSINSDNNSGIILHTQNALKNGTFPSYESKSCNDSNQQNLCYLDTDEAPNGDAVGHLQFEQVNPVWFMRVDENRGTADGSCGKPANYDQAYNTRTHFELYYYRQNEDGSIQHVQLSSYTGQDGTEAVDHETDLHWVSPGAEVSFAWDKDAPVPADPGSTTEHGFEIDLSKETPNIITSENPFYGFYIFPKSGMRYIYLDIRTIKGGSQNGFELWAGPPDYVNNVPSNVNLRNVHLRNNPSQHDSKGVHIFALSQLPQKSILDHKVDTPLMDVPAAIAGESSFISLFDFDSGAQMPITFYMDTIPIEDWSVTFGDDDLYDDDGVRSADRCLPTPDGCNDKWVNPPLRIEFPSGTRDCDFNNPTGDDCTPFYGGKLMVRYHDGVGDTFLWQTGARLEGDFYDPNAYQGCDAFPIGLHEGSRSVTNPAHGYNPYPPTDEFSYPLNPPTYTTFIDHQDNLPLVHAEKGALFKIQFGDGAGQFDWLRWNSSITNTAVTLQNSLAWPGNTFDYINHPDDGYILPGQNHVVRGFVEAGDANDSTHHLGDWMAANTSNSVMPSIATTLQEHIDLGRVLRLPIWDNFEQTRQERKYQTERFALFRIVGYKTTDAGADIEWLLLEFIRYSEACGQISTPMTDVEIEGPIYGLPDEDIVFTAVSQPISASLPITHSWIATDYPYEPYDPWLTRYGRSENITYSWYTTGTKTITVTAKNFNSTLTSTHTIYINDPVVGIDVAINSQPKLLTTRPITTGTPLELEIAVRNLGDTAVNDPIFVNLHLNPTTFDANGIPTDAVIGYLAINNLASGENRVITISLPAGLPLPILPHQIYASLSSEDVNKNNNVSPPLIITLEDYIYTHLHTLYLPIIIKN